MPRGEDAYHYSELLTRKMASGAENLDNLELLELLSKFYHLWVGGLLTLTLTLTLIGGGLLTLTLIGGGLSGASMTILTYPLDIARWP